MIQVVIFFPEFTSIISKCEVFGCCLYNKAYIYILKVFISVHHFSLKMCQKTKRAGHFTCLLISFKSYA